MAATIVETPPPQLITTIEWSMMDKRKFYPLYTLSSFTIRCCLYPLTLVKTQIQMQRRKEAYSGIADAISKIYRADGVSGLYRGFWLSSIISGIFYVSTYEGVRHELGKYDVNPKIKSFIGGGCASIVGQSIIVPFDVLSQHLMVLGLVRGRAKSGKPTVALLSPQQSMLYTWDDPTKERVLLWNVYNNKDIGYPAQFLTDGFGEQKVTLTSLKHPTVTTTNSVTSKLSSTFKRLTPMSTETCYSSSDSDSETPFDSSFVVVSSGKDKKTRKDKETKKDKVTIYWISYMEGHQRVFALIQDEKIAHGYKSLIDSERSLFEMYLSLSGATMSVCVDSTTGVKELALMSLTDSLPQWEVNVSRKWKQLSPDLTAWIEEKYQTNQKKCNHKEYIHIDLDKMQMTKPFFAEIRRTYHPAVWGQLRKSYSLTYTHFTVNRFQIDNQLPETVFPTVLYPAPLPSDLSNRDFKSKPCLEIVVLKQSSSSEYPEIYKYINVLLQAYCVNLDRGFVNYVFDILNRWKIEDKPAVRLRADLALVHTPLHMLATKQTGKRNVLMEFVHLSPIKLMLSLSSRGYSAENVTSPTKGFGKQENRPKLFNSDLLEYLFNSWGSSLCDMKDVVIRMSYIEVRNTYMSLPALLDRAARLYLPQLVQQFYVLVLGLSVLGNPYNAQDFCKELRCYYEPYLGCGRPLPVSRWVECRCAALLGHRRGPHCADGTAALGDAAATVIANCGSASATATATATARTSDEGVTTNGIPEWVIEGDRTNPASVALALTGLLASPSFDIYRSVARRWLPSELCGAERALRALAERSGGRIVHRLRLPRYCPRAEAVGPYSAHCALGAHTLRQLMPRAHYVAHTPIDRHTTLLVTTTHVVVGRSGAHNTRVEWSTLLDDLIAVPAIQGDCIVLQIKQDELTNYFATDEKCIAIPDEATRQWLQARIEAALILGLEDKRVPEH